MDKDEEFLKEYYQTIEYCEKGYAWKINVDKEIENYDKNWYLPHFPTTNLNKFGKIR